MRTDKQKLGQFLTNPTIADFMSKLVCFETAKIALDPAVGEGVFLKCLENNKKNNFNYIAYDIDETMIEKASKIINRNVQYNVADYLLTDIKKKPDIIICNPPYNRFQEIPNRKKYIELFHKKYNFTVNGYSNLYVYFLVKSLFDLNEGGKSIFIIPYEFFNTGYGNAIKKLFIQTRFLKSIYKFDNNIPLFDDVLTTSCIILLEKSRHEKVDFISIKNIEEIANETFNHINSYYYSEIDYKKKWNCYFEEKSRQKYKNLINFSKIAKVKRGIATGCNYFFALNKSRIDAFGLSQNVLEQCVCKSPDIKKIVFTETDFSDLFFLDKKVYLFNGLNAKTSNDYKYIALAEEKKYNSAYLLRQKKPWFSIEKRAIAPIWFSVFNRNKFKIIRNETQARNLTTFHSVYLNNEYNKKEYINVFFCYLITPICQDLLKKSKREYGGGLNKFEPNDLNNAKILDITLISKKDTIHILRLYDQIKNKTEAECQKVIDELNRIFTSYMT